MGTTQRIMPGVSGEPNWGDLSKAITHISKTIEEEKELDNKNISPQEEGKIYKKISDRRTAHIKSAFKKLVATGGGRKNISDGGSKSIGKAGIKSARKITGFFSGVSGSGLQQTLTDIGFGSLQGKKFQDVIDYLLIFCSDSNEGMDETAANKASCEVMKEVADLAGNDLYKFEELIKQYVYGTGLSDMLCKFWGLYIFEHLSQRFREKIEQNKGIEVAKETFKIIKDDIAGQVKVLNTHRPIAKIDWRGASGKEEINKIFDSVIKIICDENN